MRIAYLANQYNNSQNGPSKFANLLSMIFGDLSEDRKLSVDIYTSDINRSKLNIYKIHRKFFVEILSYFFARFSPRLIRMCDYAFLMKKLYNYDRVVVSNAISAFLICDKSKLYVFVNDDLNISWRKFSGLDKIKRLIFFKIEKYVVRKVAVVIANSEFLARRIAETYEIGGPKVKVLRKRVILPAITNKKKNLDELNHINILFVKSDYMIGNLELLYKVLKRFEFCFITLNVIGPKEKPNFLLDTDNLKVIFKGRTSNADVINLYESGKIDLFCTPSYFEALGVANIEAMAYMVPVIANAVGGVPEVLGDGRYGTLLSDLSEQSLFDAIDSFLKHPNAAWDKASMAYSNVYANYNINNLERDFYEILALS